MKAVKSDWSTSATGVAHFTWCLTSSCPNTWDSSSPAYLSPATLAFRTLEEEPSNVAFCAPLDGVPRETVGARARIPRRLREGDAMTSLVRTLENTRLWSSVRVWSSRTIRLPMKMSSSIVLDSASIKHTIVV